MKKQNDSIKHILRRGIAAAMLSAALFAAPSAEAAPSYLNLGISDSYYMSTELEIVRLAVGDPEIATIVELPPSMNEFLVVAHKAGATTLFVWTVDGMRQEFIVNVSPEDKGTARVIEDAIGLPRVHVRKVDNRILLTGTVKNQYERNHAIRTAQLFAGGSTAGMNLGVGSNADMSMQTMSANANTSNGGLASESATVGGNSLAATGNIIDLLQMEHPTQVRMEAQVISINPSDASSLGITYGSNSSGNTPGVFYAGESYGDAGSGRSFKNNPWRWFTDRHDAINMSINALVSQSKAKILSRPSVTTMSGETAIIQVGGQIPYTATNTNGSANTSFKNFGIILQLKPVVDAENRIVASVHTEVSNISGKNVDGQPILDLRRADSVVTIQSGSTMVIGGLMDSSDAKNYQKIPLLGDIPILGEFFKYSSSTTEKQELIILITPYLVNDEDTSTARMSEPLHDMYRKGQQEKNEMREVDLNEPVPSPVPAPAAASASAPAEEELIPDDKEAPETTAPRNDSIMGKYLNRNVLTPAGDK